MKLSLMGLRADQHCRSEGKLTWKIGQKHLWKLKHPEERNDSFSDMWDNTNRLKICIIGVPGKGDAGRIYRKNVQF